MLDKVIFDHSFVYQDQTKRSRHGAIWTDCEKDTLKKSLVIGSGLHAICVGLQRPADGVLRKAVQLRYLERSLTEDKYYYTDVTTPLPNPAQMITGLTLQDSIRDGILSGADSFGCDHAYFEPLKEKEPKVNTIEIKTQTLLNGVDISTLSDDQIFDQIAKLEENIKSLDRLEHRPKALERRIEKLKEAINLLVTVSDSRDPAAT